MPAHFPPSTHPRLAFVAAALLVALASGRRAESQAAFVRVNQVGYETGETPFRAYLMSKTRASGARFAVSNSKGAIVQVGHVGVSLGTWSHSKDTRYNVYALDFSVPDSGLY